MGSEGGERPRLVREHGGDRVVAIGDRLEVWSSRENDGWRPRKHRKIAIVIDDVRHTIVSMRSEGAHVVYGLERWEPTAAEIPGDEVIYDEAYVVAREQTAASVRGRERTSTILSLASPFVGFLWSRTKRRLHERYGIHPARATRRSMDLQFVVGFFTALFFHSNVLWIVAFPVDFLLRFHSLLQDEDEPWGFGEWLVGFFRKKHDGGRYPLEEEKTRARKLEEAARAGVASAFVRRLAEDRRLGEPRAFGRDRVFRDGEAFVIHGAEPIEGFEARKYRKLSVEIDGVRCHVVEHLVHDRAAFGVRARYRLEPWPEGWNDLPLAEVRYDAAFVEDRDESLALERRAHRANRAIEPFTALIGFLWTAPKARLELGYGISARRATMLSIVVEIATAFTLAVLHSVSTDTRWWPLPPPLLALLTTLLAADAIIRVLVILRGRAEWLGFYEWPLFLARGDD